MSGSKLSKSVRTLSPFRGGRTSIENKVLPLAFLIWSVIFIFACQNLSGTRKYKFHERRCFFYGKISYGNGLYFFRGRISKHGLPRFQRAYHHGAGAHAGIGANLDAGHKGRPRTNERPPPYLHKIPNLCFGADISISEKIAMTPHRGAGLYRNPRVK